MSCKQHFSYNIPPFIEVTQFVCTLIPKNFIYLYNDNFPFQLSMDCSLFIHPMVKPLSYFPKYCSFIQFFSDTPGTIVLLLGTFCNLCSLTSVNLVMLNLFYSQVRKKPEHIVFSCIVLFLLPFCLICYFSVECERVLSASIFNGT